MAFRTKESRNEYQRKRYAENEHVRRAQQEASKRWLEKCPREHKADSLRGWTMKYRYGMTVEQYEEKLSSQDGHCALCSATQESYARRLCVDHDHKCCPGQRSCGKCIRGILCANCNRKVGFLEEIIADGIVMPGANSWTQKAIDYIESYRGDNLLTFSNAKLHI